MQDLIDPEEFPFTEEEVYRTVRLMASESEARARAADIACGGREARASRLAALVARERGSRDPAEINHEVFYVSPEFFALLAAVSPELEARMEAYWEGYRAASRPGRLRNALYRAGLSPRQDPPEPVVLAAVEAEEAGQRKAWVETRAAVEVKLHREDREPVA